MAAPHEPIHPGEVLLEEFLKPTSGNDHAALTSAMTCCGGRTNAA